MKLRDVPQDNNSSMEGETKVIYARSDSGRIETAQTSGWDVEETVLEQAIDEIHRQAKEAHTRAVTGKTSPLEFHMYNQRMDLAMLAQAVGRFQWLVKRDFDPARFARLSPARLERYADVMGLQPDILQTLPDRYD
ncbi:MAG: hypothetical protein QNJ78_09385 [Gammaproteobacteria bacterium]|nr:hypothetical protein [Gammaproteobacteria bacterium]